MVRSASVPQPRFSFAFSFERNFVNWTFPAVATAGVAVAQFRFPSQRVLARVADVSFQAQPPGSAVATEWAPSRQFLAAAAAVGESVIL
jgi:hypothetical protein